MPELIRLTAKRFGKQQGVTLCESAYVIRSQSPCRAIIDRAARKGSIPSPLTKALRSSVERILEVKGLLRLFRQVTRNGPW